MESKQRYEEYQPRVTSLFLSNWNKNIYIVLFSLLVDVKRTFRGIHTFHLMHLCYLPEPVRTTHVCVPTEPRVIDQPPSPSLFPICPPFFIVVKYRQHKSYHFNHF